MMIEGISLLVYGLSPRFTLKPSLSFSISQLILSVLSVGKSKPLLISMLFKPSLLSALGIDLSTSALLLTNFANQKPLSAHNLMT